MKQLVAIICGTLITGCAFAQTEPLKIAYINSTALLYAMPERAKADSDVEKYAKSFQDELDIMAKDYQDKGQDYQTNSGKWTDAVKEVKTKEISDLEERIKSLQQSAQDKVQKRREEVYKPFLDRADKALKDVAKEKNFDFIFDQAAGNGVMVFGKEKYDVTDLVKAKLGIK